MARPGLQANYHLQPDVKSTNFVGGLVAMLAAAPAARPEHPSRTNKAEAPHYVLTP